jgi:2-keto-3-deoxy-L-rhamnonate aldolase RhmA
MKSKANWIKKARLENPLLGMIISTSSLVYAEIVGKSGFDWVWIDQEHSSLGASSCLSLVQILQPYVKVVIRVSSLDEASIKKALDTGCDGVLIPQISNVAQAEDAVKYCKYPPVGARSVGISRAHGYGLSFGEYLESANTKVAIIAQIESKEGCENISDILKVRGIDAILVGPYDLSGSLGVLGNVNHHLVTESIDKVLSACITSKVPCGAFFANPSAFEAAKLKGFLFGAIGIDTMLFSQAVRDSLKSIRE